MGPISPVQVGMAGHLQSVMGMMQSAGAGGIGAAGLSTSAAVGVNSAQSIMNVQAGVSQLLQSIGGGVENNRALQMLIATMILLAMLTQGQQTDEASANSLDMLGGRANSSSSYVGIYSSSTTISIQQSSTSIVLAGNLDAFSAGVSSPQSQGGQIDQSI